jgi:hypothetical protein
MRRETFAVGDEPRVEVRLASGTVLATGGEPGSVVVEIDGPGADRFRVEQRGSTIVVEPEQATLTRWGALDVTLRLPERTQIDARLASAQLIAEARLGAVDADVASGDVRLTEVADAVRVKTASGDLRARRIGGPLQFSTASGSAEVGAVAGAVRLHSASGDLRVRAASSGVSAKTASGAVRLGVFEGADLSCKTMSGDVEVGMPPGRTLDVDLQTLSGTIRNDFEVSGNRSGPATGRANVRVRTLSGDIILARAAADPRAAPAT